MTDQDEAFPAGGAGHAVPGVPEVDVLIPTRDRPVELATTLAGLAGQCGGGTGPGQRPRAGHPRFGVLVSDQSDGAPSYATAPARSMARALQLAGRPVRFTRHLPRRGLADHRAFLLSRARARYVLFLDDDVWLEPTALDRLLRAIRELGCGFVGAAVQGLSYADDVRPDELAPFEPWPGRPVPESVGPDSPLRARYTLHNAANPLHLAQRLDLPEGAWCAYKIAWVGGCVLYDRQKLLDCGGFDFGVDLPANHAGEDVAAQWRVMARYGGAGILPSGAVHLESPTTVVDRGTDLPDVLTWPSAQHVRDSA